MNHPVKHSVLAQFRISHNLKEDGRTKRRRAFWASVYMLKAICRGAKAMGREQGLSTVIYQGRKCQISNWAGGSHVNLAAKEFYAKSVPRAEIKNVIDLSELKHRFHMGISFYLGSWYEIDIQRKLYSKRPHRAVGAA